MDGASVFRLMSLIPDRASRSQTGCLFVGDGSAKMELLCRFLTWLGPLESLTKEDQQLLGVRAGGGKSLLEGEDLGDEPGEEGDDILEETAVRLPEAGTQIAA